MSGYAIANPTYPATRLPGLQAKRALRLLAWERYPRQHHQKPL